MGSLRAVRAALALAALLLVIVACGGNGDSGDEATRAPETYTVRGQIVTLPRDNGGEIRLAHEAIIDFVAADGTVVGMDSMTMSFPLAAGPDGENLEIGDIAVGHIAVGDIVEFDLRVDWSADPLATVTRVERLPADTELVFGAADTDRTDG